MKATPNIGRPIDRLRNRYAEIFEAADAGRSFPRTLTDARVFAIQLPRSDQTRCTENGHIGQFDRFELGGIPDASFAGQFTVEDVWVVTKPVEQDHFAVDERLLNVCVVNIATLYDRLDDAAGADLGSSTDLRFAAYKRHLVGLGMIKKGPATVPMAETALSI